ncbi:hypothetical protein NIES932_07240 [Raphidiopsis curvata NIES-932]|nr:hypothetical protein NIES932_07240 [Raphidiopsis curvata NIES-932]
MAYSEFTTLDKVIKTFSLQVEEDQNLFCEVKPLQPSDYLQQTLQEYLPLATAINTEKARSEFLIAPVLAELRRQTKHQISLFSGTEFNVDPKRGLVGFCDYLISHSKEQYFITVPVIAVVEAKNENIKGGLGQCIAEMVAAQLFNSQAGTPLTYIYGVVSTGTVWKFLRLENATVFIDSLEYYINQIDRILGIMMLPLCKA